MSGTHITVTSDSCDTMDYSPPGSFVHGIFPGKNTGVGCHFLLQGIFCPRIQTQGSWIADSLPYESLKHGKMSTYTKQAQKTCVSASGVLGVFSRREATFSLSPYTEPMWEQVKLCCLSASSIISLSSVPVLPFLLISLRPYHVHALQNSCYFIITQLDLHNKTFLKIYLAMIH